MAKNKIRAPSYFDMVRGMKVVIEDGSVVPFEEIDSTLIVDKIKNIRERMGASPKKGNFRKDRIVWTMRHIKKMLAVEMMRMCAMCHSKPPSVEARKFFKEKLNGRLPAAEQPHLQTVVDKLGFVDLSTFEVKATGYVVAYYGIERLMERLDHFMGVAREYADREPDNAVMVYEFDKQPFTQVVKDLEELEGDLKEKYLGSVVNPCKGGGTHPEHTGTEYVECSDGETEYIWFNLHSPNCSQEATAVGHCGNSGARGSNQTILSLREFAGKHSWDRSNWKAHLTFILHPDEAGGDAGYLGEMKGRGNNHPRSKYFPQIVALLKDPRIRGLRGGGYLQSHNFHIEQLPKELMEELHEARPDLFLKEGWNCSCDECWKPEMTSGRGGRMSVPVCHFCKTHVRDFMNRVDKTSGPEPLCSAHRALSD